MLYVVKKDFTDFFKKNYGMFIGMFIVIICYGVYSKNNYSNIKQLFTLILGLHIYKDFFSVDFIIFIFHLGISLYIMSWLFFKMVSGNIENLFLRLSMKKWFYYKVISIMLLTSLIKVLLYITSIFISGYCNMLQIIFFFFTDLILTFFEQFLMMWWIGLFYQNKIKFIITIIFSVCIIYFLPLTVISIVKNPMIIIIYIMLLFLVFCLIKQNMVNIYNILFERSK